MKLHLKNGRYLDVRTMTVKRGSVCTDGGVFSYVGEDPPEDSFDRIIDLNGNLVIPGLCDAHTHSPMVFLRSFAEDLPLDKWLTEAVFPHEAKLTPEDNYTLTKLAVAEYVSNGITSCFDMYYFPEAMAKAFTETGFRCVFCGALNNFSESPEKLEEYYLKFNDHDPLISYKLGFHAEYTTSLELMKAVAGLAHKYKAPVWCHNSETKSETEECIARYGKTPTGIMDSIGMFDFGGGGYHCIYLTPEDYDIFARRNMTVVTNPCSNLKLASGIADTTEVCRRGIGLAIGTDGAASNNALDMFREMYLCSVLRKLRSNDAAAMPAENVLRAATLGGAAAMEINSGVIETGRNADFAVIDMSAPNMQPENDIVKNLVYSGSGANVTMTAVNGNILYEKGEFFIGEDMDALYGMVRKICERIFS
ncbi:MAG: amidohydrolase family protein [Huintestinicola sp.]|uniref:amidohydrolase family protein n=1 Tax=Huintestinicola sp. TaxID=2981661 RepID=UPI003F0F71DA